MSIVKRNEVFFPSLLNEIFKPDWFGGMDNLGAKIPPVNIIENEKYFEIELAVPGYKKENFKIEIDKNVLTISVKKEEEIKDEKIEERRNFTRKEFEKYSFERGFNLPENVEEEGIEASYKNGILSFVLPKKIETLPKAKREINLM
ncbi:Hsp20/alpha crystallin family protein [Maribacter sp.]|uniref:Hsp20/alpha crystallin family protein n=1 Tax=Maribacter sp. TaxID=1897614 RepID=UPI0025C2AD0C|nr:Hsp20/alpha crystallin family protein [Maribacter sp.]